MYILDYNSIKLDLLLSCNWLEALTLIKQELGKWSFVRQRVHLSRAKKRETQREIYLWKETPS